MDREIPAQDAVVPVLDESLAVESGILAEDDETNQENGNHHLNARRIRDEKEMGIIHLDEVINGRERACSDRSDSTASSNQHNNNNTTSSSASSSNGNNNNKTNSNNNNSNSASSSKEARPKKLHLQPPSVPMQSKHRRNNQQQQQNPKFGQQHGNNSSGRVAEIDIGSQIHRDVAGLSISEGSPLSEQTGGEEATQNIRRRRRADQVRHQQQILQPQPQPSNKQSVISHASPDNPIDFHAIQKPADDATGAGKSAMNSDKWAKLNNLALLYEQGFILETEYKERRSQLIDELTGTRSTTGTSCSTTGTSTTNRRIRKVRRRRSRVSSSIVIPRPPPTNFDVIPAEKAIKHYFDLTTRTWYAEEVFVRIDDTPFAKGGLRLVYHLQEVSPEEYYSTIVNDEEEVEEGEDDGRECTYTTTITTATTYGAGLTASGSNQQFHSPNMHDPIEDIPTITDSPCLSRDHFQPLSGTLEASAATMTEVQPMKRRMKRVSYVAKIAIDPNEDPSTYFRDVEAQAHCAHYGRLFNTYQPPRLVEFVKAWILELTERQGSPLCAVEKFVPGPYKKHNNNYGYVSEDIRNTPQAFSHFTYEASAHTMLVVDIQGVDTSHICSYTDPQIHTLNQDEFGKGNLGIRGFHKFLSTHRCNAICRYLKLPPVNPSYTMEGTIPNLPFMPATKINRSLFKEGHYFESTPALRNLVKAKAKARRRKKHEVTVEEDDDDDDEEHTDSFLQSYLWDTRHHDGSICSFFPCSIL